VPLLQEQDQAWQQQLNHKKVLLVAGQQSNARDAHAILNFAEQMGWPLIADCQSQLKGQAATLNYADQLLHNPGFVEALSQAELIIQFGARLVSKRLQQFIDNFNNPCWLVASGNERLAPGHNQHKRFCQSASQWLVSIKQPAPRQWRDSLAPFEHKAAQLLAKLDNHHSELSEYWVCRQLGRLLANNCRLMLGNSMPIRLFEMFSFEHAEQLQIFSNRGASGIDGVLATAAGIAAHSPGQPMVLLLGDTSLLHDLNSLALLAHYPLLTIVLNNNGGGIFNLLPVPNEQGQRDNFYQLPHGLGFAQAAAMFAVDYALPLDQQEFKKQLASYLQSPRAMLLEVKVPANQTSELVSDLGKQIAAL
jgi:2-succinyl-5-enolpyruvyl-6-hydroxy-3-cyclohexene-1-carboxylate synthase